MDFATPLIPATLEKRYKRFLADVILENGERVTAHCPNSGSMMGLKDPGSSVLLSYANNPNRKLQYGLEMVRANGTWVGINTQYPNRLAADAIEAGLIPQLIGYDSLKREVVYAPGTRLDICLSSNNSPPCYIEVKNVTLKEGERALFPDAVTTRGLKHLQTLTEIVQKGDRAIGLYIVQRSDCTEFDIADYIDPAYGKAFDVARAAGVEILCYACHLSPNQITLAQELPLQRNIRP